MTRERLKAPGQAMVKDHVQGDRHEPTKGWGRQVLQGPEGGFAIGDAIDIAMEGKAPGKARWMGAGKGSGKKIPKKGA